MPKNVLKFPKSLEKIKKYLKPEVVENPYKAVQQRQFVDPDVISRYIRSPETAKPTRPTAEELLPISEPEPVSEQKKLRAQEAIIHAEFNPVTKMWRVRSGRDMKWYDLTQSEYEIVTRFTDTPGLTGVAGDITGQRLQGREAAKEVQAALMDILKQKEKNADTLEAREKYRSQIEQLGNVDQINWEDLEVYDPEGIVESMLGDIPSMALGVGVAGLGGSKFGTGAGVGIAGITAAASVAGSYYKGTAKGASSTAQEYMGQFQMARMELEKVRSNVRMGEPVSVVDLNTGEIVTNDPVEAFNYYYEQILESEAYFKKIYEDEYFNLETPIGKNYRKIVTWRMGETRYMAEFAQAMVVPPTPDSPEYAAAAQEAAQLRAGSIPE